MGWVSQGQHLSWRRASFAGTKFGGGGKARAGKNSFPPTPFLFARPSDWISEFAVRIFVKKSSDFNQKAPPVSVRYKNEAIDKIVNYLGAYFWLRLCDDGQTGGKEELGVGV